MEQCRKHPELIYFLRMEDAFKNVYNKNILGWVKFGEPCCWRRN